MDNRKLQIVGGIAIVALGIFLVGFGLFQYGHIVDMEAAGHVHGLSTKVQLVYTLLGKWGVLGVFSLAGALAFVSGLDKLMNWSRASA